MKAGSQNHQLVRFLFHEQRSITRLSALMSLGIANITARITELRDLGYEIDSQIKVDMQGKKYVSYVGVSTPNQRAAK